MKTKNKNHRKQNGRSCALELHSRCGDKLVVQTLLDEGHKTCSKLIGKTDNATLLEENDVTTIPTESKPNQNRIKHAPVQAQSSRTTTL